MFAFRLSRCSSSIVCAVLVGCLALSSGLMSVSYAAGAKVVLVASHAAPPTHGLHKAFEKMDEVMRAKSKGGMALEIHSSASLAEEEEAIEALQIGTIDITSLSAAPMTGFVKEFMACDLPYLFRNESEAYRFYDGPVGDMLFAKAGEKGLVGLCWWENGFRHFTNRVRPIRTPEDLRGLKIRTMSSAVHIATMRALSASPVPIAFGELFSALQQGVVDGEENTLTLIRDMKFYEVQKYLTLSYHFYDPSPLFISQKTWQKLTSEQQAIVKAAAIEARDYMRKLMAEENAKTVQDLKSMGMQVTELTDSEFRAFQAVTADVGKQFEKEIGAEFLAQFMKAAQSK